MNDNCPLKAKKWLSYAKSNLCDLNRVRFSMKGEVGSYNQTPTFEWLK